LRLEAREELTQQNGFLHGGVVAALVDVASGEAIKSGRTLTIVRSEVSAVKDGVEGLCAAGQGSLMTRRP
jgi:acyl-coenzyme A thioesterase PaaI-like protein